MGDLYNTGWSANYHVFEVDFGGVITKENGTTLFITKICRNVK